MDYPKSLKDAKLHPTTGKFSNGADGNPVSRCPSEWGNAITDEILQIIQAAKITPDEKDVTQLLAALNKLYLGINNAAADSAKLVGQPASFYAKASDIVAAPGIVDSGNRLINGGFTIDQRNQFGTVPVPSNSVLMYTADRWYVACSGASVYVQVTPGLNNFANKLTIAGTNGNTGLSVGQRIQYKNIADMAGGPATITIDVDRCDVPITMTLYSAGFADNFGTIASPYRTAVPDGSMIIPVKALPGRYSLTFTVPNNQKGLEVCFTCNSLKGANVFNINNVQLEKGNVSNPIIYRPPAVELLLCQHYFEILQGDRYIVGTPGNSTTGKVYVNEQFKIEKRTIPNITLTSPRWFNSAFNSGSSVSLIATSARDVTYLVNLGVTGAVYQAIMACAQKITIDAEL